MTHLKTATLMARENDEQVMPAPRTGDRTIIMR